VKKLLVLVVAAVLTLGGAIGCGGTASTSAPAKTGSTEK
jgi:hypothetical protein